MKRRDFLENMALLTGSFWLSGFETKAWANPLLRNLNETDGRIMVIVQLSGGNDGFNTVVPIEDSIYYAKRPKIAIPKAEALPLNNLTALNPALTGFQTLFKEGKLAVVQGIGYDNPDRSHFRSTDIWLSASDSNEFIFDGWAGRYLSTQFPDFPSKIPAEPMAVQLGSTESMLLHSHAGSMGLVFENPNAFYQLVAGSTVDSDPPPATLAGEELRYLKQIATQSVQFRDVVKKASDKGKNLVTYPNSRLAQQLSIIAKLINGGLQTPVYLTVLGGFDTHANQLTAHSALLKQLGDAVLSFQQDIDKMGYGDRVTLMTFSEFGRRLYENGSLGTDHGTAAPLFVVGKTVKGGIIGTNPDLTNLDKTGDIIHQYDYRQVYSAVLQDHLGISKTEATQILGKDYAILPIYRSQIKISNPTLDFELKQNFPNPFQNETTIQYVLQKAGNVRLSIIDMTGKEIRKLVEATQQADGYEVLFSGQDLMAGLYLCVLEVDGKRASKRLVLTK